MNGREARRFFSRQLTETHRLHKMVEDHPLMGPLMAQREAEYVEELAKLPVAGAEARTVLFFTGKPVVGSSAIDAKFVAEALNPFLEIVKSQYAAEKHGPVGQRGPRKDEDEARLMLTGTPRGSFGLELSPPQTDDLFAEDTLSSVLIHVTRLMEAAGESDEGFLLNLDDISPRTFTHVPKFFKVLQDFGADLRMQTGDIEFQLTQDQIRQAYERVNSSKTVEETLTVPGSYRGALLDTWRFDFRREDSSLISGRIDGDLSEDDVAGWAALVNKPSVATILETTTITSGGALRRRYILKSLEPTS